MGNEIELSQGRKFEKEDEEESVIMLLLIRAFYFLIPLCPGTLSLGIPSGCQQKKKKRESELCKFLRR